MAHIKNQRSLYKKRRRVREIDCPASTVDRRLPNRFLGDRQSIIEMMGDG